MPPFFTILTSTYNAAATLPALLDSLACQTCRDFNWIVQDGLSSDGTMDIVARYRNRLPEILSDSAKDFGIYDAWNKAIERWKEKIGEWVLILGADDVLHDKDTLLSVKKKISAVQSNIIFACGSLELVDTNYNVKYVRIVHRFSDFSCRFSGMPLSHPALFTRKKTIFQNKFDGSFKIAGDYDFILRTWKSPLELMELDIIVTKMGDCGVSNQKFLMILMEKEVFRAIHKQNIFKSYSYYLQVLLKNIKIFFRYLLKKNSLGLFFLKLYSSIKWKILNCMSCKKEW